MAFALQPTPSYWWPLSIETPVDGGRNRRETFELQFRRLPQSRVEEILAQQIKLRRAIETNSDDLGGLMGLARHHAAEIVCDWRGILDTDGGEQIPFSETALLQLLEVPGMPSVILSTYIDTIPKAKEKN